MKEEAKSSLFLELIPQLKESRNCLEKVVLLTCRSARKRNRIARSLGGEGIRIVLSFGWEGILPIKEQLFQTQQTLFQLQNRGKFRGNKFCQHLSVFDISLF